MQNEPNKHSVWMVIEITPAILELDRQNGVKTDERGNLLCIPDENKWRPLRPSDVPEWLKSEDAIRDLVNGQRLCADPIGTGHWYRAVLCYPNESESVH